MYKDITGIILSGGICSPCIKPQKGVLVTDRILGGGIIYALSSLLSVGAGLTGSNFSVFQAPAVAGPCCAVCVA